MDIKGIDISSYHGKIDWEKVKADGIQFVIIRAGWGKANSDTRFTKNIKDAINCGLNIGVYWYLYAKNERDIVANADKCDAVINAFRKSINMKVWAIWQEDSDKYRGKNNKTERTTWLKKFCELMTEKGYDMGIYSGVDYLNKRLNKITEYPIWLGYYATNLNNHNPFMWQYSTSGKVDGIITRVNLNYLIDANYKIVEPIPIPKTYPELTKGMRSEYIKMFKSRLTELGYQIEDMSNMYDPKLIPIVKKFQEDNDLVVDGVIGSNTWNKLYK